MFPNDMGANVLEFEWDHLIVLDACRCDIFEKVYQCYLPENASFKRIQSTTSSRLRG